MKDQMWGPCGKCGGNYTFETLAGYGYDAFKVTKIVCLQCGFTVTWDQDKNGSAPDEWQRVREAAKPKVIPPPAEYDRKLETLKKLPPPTEEEVLLQMKSSEKEKEGREAADTMCWAVGWGAIVKMRIVPGPVVPCVSVRRADGKWGTAYKLCDPHDAYKDLGVDQLSIACVKARGDEVRVKVVSTAALDENGDSTTVAKAMRMGKFDELAEKIYKSTMRKIGPLKLLSDDTDTIVYPEMLMAAYDPADVPVLRKAYAHEMREDLGALTDQRRAEELYTKEVAAFNAFLDKVQDGDEIFWYEKWAPLAARAGYIILRNGKIAAHKLMLMG